MRFDCIIIYMSIGDCDEIHVFTNKSCDDTYSVCMNGLNLSRVFVTKFLGVHMQCLR